MEIIYQIASLLASVFLLLIVLYKLEVWTTARLAKAFGWNAVLITGIVGTPIHEIGHLLFCLIFGHKVHEVALFSPDKKTGTLGYIRHSYNRRSIYQKTGTLFIGLAPFVSGILALWLLTYLMFPQFLITWKTTAVSDIANTSLAQFGRELLENVEIFIGKLFTRENIGNWKLWIYLYLGLCIASHLAPSTADLKGTWPGIIILVVFILVACGIIYYFDTGLERHHVIRLKNHCCPIFTYLLFAVMLSGLNLILTYLMTLVLGRR